MSRIYYGGKFFDYPLRPLNALRNLGVVEAVRCVGSYVWARVRPPKDQHNFEGWVAARFGWRLYRIFFKTYTEKVWGVPATDDPGRLGRAAHQGPVAGRTAMRERAAAPARPDRDHQPHRGVPVPEVRPRHDVGARAAELVADDGVEVRPQRPGHRSRTTTAADGRRRRRR